SARTVARGARPSIGAPPSVTSLSVRSVGSQSYGARVTAVGGVALTASGPSANITIAGDVNAGTLTMSAATIDVHNATTAGAQAYTGAVSLHSGYTTTNAGFTVTGATTLLSNTYILVGSAAVSLKG